MNPVTVSIIIPCFNAERYISDTIHSVIEQSFPDFELICINDGSTDNTGKKIIAISDPRIKYISKQNSGVSSTRNAGFELSRGKYILFLDADDILSHDFLKARVEYLDTHPSIEFCCSEVIKIDENGKKITETKWTGAYSNILEEVLSYNLSIITCPSNYLFRKNILTQHSLKFDTDLSSSADRFFLVELSNVAKCGFVEKAYLYYRMHNSSMSHKLTPDLLKDNSIFKKKILAIDFIPGDLKKEFNFKTNYILAGSYFKLGKLFPFFAYAIRSFYYNPIGFIKQLKK